MGKKLDNIFVFRQLGKKGVKIDNTTIDISNAKDLGNKSWGYIDFLCRGLSLIGKRDYEKKNFHIKKDTDTPSKRVQRVNVEGERRGHSYEGIPQYEKYGNSRVEVSEYTHMVELNHFQDKFKREIFKKNDVERKVVNKLAMKENLSMPFENRVMIQWTSDNESPTKVINVNH